MRMKVLAMVLMLVLVPQMVSATTVRRYCVNSTHEYSSYNESYMIDGVASTYSYEQYALCTHGCVNDMCHVPTATPSNLSPDPSMFALYIGLGILSLVMVTLAALETFKS